MSLKPFDILLPATDKAVFTSLVEKLRHQEALRKGELNCEDKSKLNTSGVGFLSVNL